jgi:putative Holliday junction resolvase
MRLGRRIGIDYGAVRIGVAVSTIDSILCSPLTTVQNSETALQELASLIDEQGAIEVYVGLPLNLSGDFTKSTESALELAKGLAKVVGVDVRLVDERMSTRAAQGQMQSSGKNSKQSRSLIDGAAASLILEGALAFEQATGKQPGRSVLEFDE